MGVGRTSKKVRTFRPTSLIAQEMLPSKQQKSKRANRAAPLWRLPQANCQRLAGTRYDCPPSPNNSCWFVATRNAR